MSALLAPTPDQRHAQVQRELDERIESARKRASKQRAAAERACHEATVTLTIRADARFVHGLRWWCVTTACESRGRRWLAQSMQVACDSNHALQRHLRQMRKTKGMPRSFRIEDMLVNNLSQRGGAAA